MNSCNLPPIDKDCPTLAPPVIFKAPVVVDVEFTEEVTARPETDNISELGLKNSVKSFETAIPTKPEAELIGLVNKRVWLRFSDPIATCTPDAVVAKPERLPVTFPETLPVTFPVTFPETPPVTLPETLPVKFPVTLPDTPPVTLPETFPVIFPVTFPDTPPVTLPETLPVTFPDKFPVTLPDTLPVTLPTNDPYAILCESLTPLILAPMPVTHKLPPMPTPPDTVKAPVPDDIDAVV